MQALVRVSNGEFVVGAASTPFRFIGANSYHLLSYAADPRTRHLLLRLLDFYAEHGLTVLRTWAFSDLQHANRPPDPSSAPRKAVRVTSALCEGAVNATVGSALDFVLDEAAKRGLKLLLVLTNYWGDCGGMPQYIQWVEGLPPDRRVASERFYTDPACFNAFVAYISEVLNRRNHLNGKLYKDDPTIFAWSVANEPRFMGDRTTQPLHEWLGAIGAVVKGIDPNHLLTFGSEGFFGPSTPEMMKLNPYDTSDHGVDFLSHGVIPCYDFCSFHLWPVNWGIQGDQARIEFAQRWIAAHSALKPHLGKPIVLTEFGMQKHSRTAYLTAILPKVREEMWAEGEKGIRGALIWHLATPEYPDYDGNTLYLSAPSQEMDPDTALYVSYAQDVAQHHRGGLH